MKQFVQNQGEKQNKAQDKKEYLGKHIWFLIFIFL